MPAAVILLKGTVQQDFLPLLFSQVPCSVSGSVSNLASNLRKYSRLLIDSPRSFTEEVDTPYIIYYRELRATPRIVYSRVLQMYGFSAESAACHFIGGVDTTRIIYSRKTLMTVGRHFNNFKELPLPFKALKSKKSTIHVEHCSPGTL